MFLANSIVIKVRDEKKQVEGGGWVGGDKVATLSFDNYDGDSYVGDGDIRKLMNFLTDEIYYTDPVKFEVIITGTNNNLDLEEL